MAFQLPDHVEAPAVGQLYAYWLGKCQGHRFPRRDQIDPLEMKPFLPYVIIFDVEHRAGGYRFRNRLVGTHIVELFGTDVTGLDVEEKSTAEDFPAVYARLAAVIEQRQPRYGISRAPLANREFVRFEHLTVPLSTDGQIIDMLLGVRCGLGPK
jgi:hypothetical protein